MSTRARATPRHATGPLASGRLNRRRHTYPCRPSACGSTHSLFKAIPTEAPFNAVRPHRQTGALKPLILRTYGAACLRWCSTSSFPFLAHGRSTHAKWWARSILHASIHACWRVCDTQLQAKWLACSSQAHAPVGVAAVLCCSGVLDLPMIRLFLRPPVKARCSACLSCLPHCHRDGQL